MAEEKSKCAGCVFVDEGGEEEGVEGLQEGKAWGSGDDRNQIGGTGDEASAFIGVGGDGQEAAPSASTTPGNENAPNEEAPENGCRTPVLGDLPSDFGDEGDIIKMQIYLALDPRRGVLGTWQNVMG